MITLPDTLSVAVSPCPNDTFIFGALVLGLVLPPPGCALRFAWEDVQTLNEMAAQGRVQVIKLSAAAALALPGYQILDAGGAFGLHADGPKLVTRPGFSGRPATIAVPGLSTTAFALLRLAVGRDFEPLPMSYDRIKDAVLQGQADAGLLIHETALVYQRHGLDLRLDLGSWWARETDGLPLPLGVIAARKDLGAATIQAVDGAIRASLEAARADREPIWPLVRSLAQELDDDTLDRHIRAYVNDYSLSMGEQGRAALAYLSKAL